MSNDTFLKGIDISHHNGMIDWESAPLSDISFVYMKATEGIAFKDGQFARNHSFLKNSGIPRGAYHFFRPTLDLALGRDAQSRNFLSVVTALGPGDLPPVLDVEVTDGECLGVILDGVHRWLEKVHAALGRMPMIYTSASFWNTALSGTGEFAKYPLWVANYTEKPTPHIPNGFTDYTLWQYSESGAIKGINGNVDMNRFNGTRADLQSLAGLSRPVSIELASEQIEGGPSGIHDDAEFSFFGHGGQHVSIKVSAPGSIRGSLIFPSGKVEGAPSGLVFEEPLPETGNYLIRIRESPMGEGWDGMFKLSIVIER